MSGKDEIVSMEKVHSRKVARGEGSESTGTRDLQSVEETHKLSISIQKKVTPGDNSSLDEKFRRLTESYDKGKIKPPKAKIQRVPFSLRNHKYFKKYFEPRAVALGPIHHGKPGYELAEEYKPRLAEFFIRESGCDKVEMYNKVENDIKTLRACYEDEVTKCYDDKELAWMLFVDGCSLLGFITCMVEGKLEEMNVKNDLAAFGQQDTFLLENQLPGRLLRLLIDQSTKNKDKWNKNIHVFIDKVKKHTITLKKSRGEGGSEKGKTESIREDCPHLLHLLRERLLGYPDTENRPSDDSSSRNTARKQLSSSSSKHGSKSKDAFVVDVPDNPNRSDNIYPGFFPQKTASKSPPKGHNEGGAASDYEPTTFRNIKELKSAGIRVRPNKSSRINEVSFQSGMFFPTLFLSSIVVDDWTAPKFLNLVAYETCPDFHNDFGITSYICFLDSLIDQPEDVKDLRDAEILYNILGSDEEVATLFNEISTDLVPDENAYSHVKEKIQKHYNRAWTEWVAVGYHKHFSNPWTLFALLGALLGLALSFIQAITALYPDDSCTKICHA